MSQFDSFTVISTHAATATLTVEWVCSIDPELKLVLDHRIPLEAEEDGWTRSELQAYFAKQVNPPTAIPSWATAEEAVENVSRVQKAYQSSGGK